MEDHRLSRPLVAGAALVVAAGLSIALARRSPAPDERITYPPVDIPKPLGENLWIVDSGPISAMGMKLPLRMTIVRLHDGGVLLHSPTRYTADLARAIEAIGPIRHLVAPTIAHWTFLADWQRAYPHATTWGVPGLRDRAQVREAGVRIDADLGEGAPAQWSEDITQGNIRGAGGFCETWFFHQPSRTLLLCDLIENLEPGKLPPLTALLMRVMGGTRATTGYHVRAAVSLKKADAERSARAMIATNPQRVLFAHGEFFGEHGREQLQRALAWLV